MGRARRLARYVLFRAAAVALSLLVLLVLGEVVVRIFVPRSESEFRDFTALWQRHARLRWVYAPDLDVP